jgi:hypothetical protein
MPQVTALATGVDLGDSATITVAAGNTNSIGLFSEFGTGLKDALAQGVCVVQLLTPGQQIVVGALTAEVPVVQVKGPGTYRVSRPACRLPVGVFSES